ncbi:hypothetical protein Nepgr_032406 [Nepenthes gracilis]|uniref:Uncharacterized protein n=1 Tax=Nepenthes gracilis TaxID=150966 RepID=A0AAD3TKD3_NEPGR|nr:hypothetical protein Nepgr_032406 [Nepenthes gracilis]
MKVNVAYSTPHSVAHLQSASEIRGRIFACRRQVRRLGSTIFGPNAKLLKSQFCGYIKPTRPAFQRSCRASYYDLNGEEFTRKREELTQQKVHVSLTDAELEVDNKNIGRNGSAATSSHIDILEPTLLGIRPEPPDWPSRDEMIRDTIARRANSIELPLSLRMLKKKQRMMEAGGESGEIDLSSTKMVFASAVYIIRELHGHALHMRGIALDEDMEAIVGKVQGEMNSSFVWLFREVFSRTPDLMVDVMVLVANYAVCSMGKQTRIESSTSTGLSENNNRELTSTNERKKEKEQRPMKLTPLFAFSLENVRDAKDVGGFSSTTEYPSIMPHENLRLPLLEMEEGMNRNEVELWNSMVQEASRMQGELQDLGLVHGTLQQFVSPVTVEIEADDYVEYHRTDLLYQIGVSEEPNNPLFLCNYAQFLYLVARDYDRAEECFHRAIQVDSTDAEVLSQYATFLWIARKDLWRAEERYQQAMAADPNNPYHASKYASFLWSTGGDDTCYPLNVPHSKI